MIASILPGILALLVVLTVTLQERAFRRQMIKLLDQKMDELINVSHMNAEDRETLGLPPAPPQPPKGPGGVGISSRASEHGSEEPLSLTELFGPKVEYVPNCENKHEWSGLSLEPPRRSINDMYEDEDGWVYVRKCTVCGFRQIRGDMVANPGKTKRVREWHDD